MKARALATAATILALSLGAGMPVVQAAGAKPSIGKPTSRQVRDSAGLLAVSCATPTRCVAAGGADGSTVSGGVIVPIADGVPGTPIIDSGVEEFDGISCVTATTCVLAGDYADDTAAVFVLKHRVVTAIPLSETSPNVVETMSSVSCYSTTRCLATGSGVAKNVGGVGELVSVNLSGATPTQTTVTDASIPDLLGISCPDSHFCAVAGGSSQEVLRIASGNTSTANLSPIGSVLATSCLSGNSCEAVGVTEDTEDFTYTAYADHLTGHHAGVPAAISEGQLLAATTLGTSHYLLTGLIGVGEEQAIMTNATGKVVANPEGLSTAGALYGASCPTVTTCIAVGWTDSSGTTPGGDDGRDGVVVTLPIHGLATAPHPPTITVTKVTKTTARVRVTAPSNTGGDPITGYQVRVLRCTKHQGKCVYSTTKTIALTHSHRTVTVRHLRAHTRYAFQATATTAAGTSAWSARVSKTTKA